MKSPKDAICAEVELVYRALDRGQYDRASNTAHNLTKLAYSLESVDDVFLGETLNAIYNSIIFVLQTYHVEKEDWNMLHAQMLTCMSAITEGRRTGKKIGEQLHLMRFHATAFVLTADQRYQRLPPPEQRGQR